MTGHSGVNKTSAPGRRQAKAWRGLVAMQVAVAAVILLSLLVIFLIGVFGSFFAQRTL